MSASTSFVARERAAQAQYFGERGQGGYKGAPYRLDTRGPNLAPSIRGAAETYFKDRGIVWHRHTSHGLSSQVCCLNFLMPLAEHPGMLSALVARALDIEAPEMLPVEDGPHGRPWYVGFEWIGGADHLGEWRGGKASRGANATSADAVVRFRSEGRVETLLIEWKYTEAYGARLSGGETAAKTRSERYSSMMFAPVGPLKPDTNLPLSAFFYEPFYQLLRQQMLAFRMQAAGEDGAERVRVLHISPAGNTALHAVTSPALARRGADAFEVFRSLLVRPEDFVPRSTEALFNPLIDAPDAGGWGEYLRDRYRFMSRPDSN